MKTLTLRNLSIGYHTGRGLLSCGSKHRPRIRVVANNLNHSLRAGEMTCLLGANGIGKSTLLRTLAGFQPPLDGDILINNNYIVDDVLKFATDANRVDSSSNYTDTNRVDSDVSACSLCSLSRQELSRTIGIVLTERPDVRQMTVEALVAMGRQPYTGFWGSLSDIDRQAIDAAISMVGIEALRRRNVAKLSDGERQKVMIAKTLAQQTPIILLDEPTAFLDYHSKVDMLTLLSDICHQTGKTIFLSTHDVELALQLADRLWLMQKNTHPAPQGDITTEGLQIKTENTQPALQQDIIKEGVQIKTEEIQPALQQDIIKEGSAAESSVTIISGTPSELAADGTLSAFLAHPAIAFDTTTGLLRVNKRK